jgi:hypothetical protein
MDIKNSADYQTLKKLASALWKKENHFHGAAVLIPFKDRHDLAVAEFARLHR